MCCARCGRRSRCRRHSGSRSIVDRPARVATPAPHAVAKAAPTAYTLLMSSAGILSPPNPFPLRQDAASTSRPRSSRCQCRRYVDAVWSSIPKVEASRRWRSRRVAKASPASSISVRRASARPALGSRSLSHCGVTSRTCPIVAGACGRTGFDRRADRRRGGQSADRAAAHHRRQAAAAGGGGEGADRRCSACDVPTAAEQWRRELHRSIRHWFRHRCAGAGTLGGHSSSSRPAQSRLHPPRGAHRPLHRSELVSLPALISCLRYRSAVRRRQSRSSASICL